MILGLDTETTGLSILHGCRPFYVSTCDEKGNLRCWKWDVDPMTREPLIPDDDLDAIDELLGKARDIVIHNAAFDVRALDSVGIRMPWSIITDTLIASHAIHSAEPHGLKPLCEKYLWLPNDDEEDLHKAVVAARRFGRKMKWRIAEEGDPHFPGVKFKAGEDDKEGRESWRFDMWLPAAVAKHLKYPKDHPWHTVLDKYAQWDAVRVILLHLAQQAYLKPGFKCSSTIGAIRVAEMSERLQRCVVANHNVLRVVYDMETQGVPVSKKRLFHLIDQSTMELKKAQRILRKAAPDVNVASHKQLPEFLYKTLKLPVVKRTATGRPATDKKTLTKLWGVCQYRVGNRSLLSEKEKDAAFKDLQHLGNCRVTQAGADFLTQLLIARKLEKYLDYLAAYSDFLIAHQPASSKCPTRGRKPYRLHPRYNVVGTRTTRFSSDNPNQQNIAKGGDGDIPDYINEILKKQGLSLRSIFVPPEDEIWFAIDFEQLQLRIFAAVAKDEALLEAFRSGADIHEFVARRLFRLKPDQTPSTDQRRIAKNINFGNIFGAGENKIEATAGIEGVFQEFKELFPNADGFMSATIEVCKRDGFVFTPGGYPIQVDKNHTGVNFIVQGAEGEIVKRAMVVCASHLKHHSLKSLRGRILMNVHDELVFAFKKPKCDDPLTAVTPAIRLMKHTMEQAGRFFGIETPAEVKLIKSSWAEGEVLKF